jgi:hypothetical protein
MIKNIITLVCPVLLLVVLNALPAAGQIDPNNVPKPPTVELKKFEPFLGKYTVTADYAGLKFSGTLEIKPVIKGWYIERTIMVKNEDGRIDREFRTMITFDTSLNSYRAWRFETVQPRNNEMSGRFVGNEYIEESEGKAKNGSKQIFRNRSTLTSTGDLRIVTEIQDAAGQVRRIGLMLAKRVK